MPDDFDRCPTCGQTVWMSAATDEAPYGVPLLVRIMHLGLYNYMVGRVISGVQPGGRKTLVIANSGNKAVPFRFDMEWRALNTC